MNDWSGRTACALQKALRMSNEAFAEHLDVGVRTVATWHQRPDRVPQTDTQQLLDTALERAPEAAKQRFAQLIGDADSAPPPPEDTVALRVAIAVVVRDSEVLLVQRRGEDGGGISWQFPAGMIKPGAKAEKVAVREALGETDVHCAVVRHLGRRLHPVTHVVAEYLLCEYLGGAAKTST
ncbi:MAG: NUDIX domain-containing protein [Thermocrispum sp.]